MKPKTQPQPTPSRSASSQTPNKQEIDAAIQTLSHFISKNPQKAAEVFKSWLETPGKSKKNIQKKSAA